MSIREIIVDIETTGLDFKRGDKIIEIACVELINHVETENYLQFYCSTNKIISEEAKKVHGLSNDFLNQFPTFANQVQKFLTSSPGARALFNEKFISLMSSLLGSNKNRLLIDGPALFVNRPNTERLLYKWHSEAHYYPKRRRFFNIWLPLFDRKSKTNWTMSFKEKSHNKDFPFSDYQGYNQDTQNHSNYFVQYEIPSNLLQDYKEHLCEVKPTDMIVFHKNLVHTSNQNISEKYSIAVVARAWDPTDDLTITGSLNATPYGGNLGRPNLFVDSLDK